MAIWQLPTFHCIQVFVDTIHNLQYYLCTILPNPWVRIGNRSSFLALRIPALADSIIPIFRSL